MNATIKPAALRDLQAMARRGADFDYVRRVFDWSPEKLQLVCAVYSVSLPGTPAKDIEAGSSKAGAPSPRAYLRKSQDDVLSETIGVATSKAIRIGGRAGGSQAPFAEVAGRPRNLGSGRTKESLG